MSYSTKKNNKENTAVATAKKKVFSANDLISCVSITPGELFIFGKKSDTLYTFADIDDVVEIEFRDLDLMARSKEPLMMKPRFVVQDEDFITLHPILDDIYSSLNSVQDLKNILKFPPAKMTKVIESLPLGAKDALKTIAITMIDEGELDSINRIKELDKTFGTEMLLKLTANE